MKAHLTQANAYFASQRKTEDTVYPTTPPVTYPYENKTHYSIHACPP